MIGSTKNNIKEINGKTNLCLGARGGSYSDFWRRTELGVRILGIWLSFYDQTQKTWKTKYGG